MDSILELLLAYARSDRPLTIENLAAEVSMDTLSFQSIARGSLFNAPLRLAWTLRINANWYELCTYPQSFRSYCIAKGWNHQSAIRAKEQVLRVRHGGVNCPPEDVESLMAGMNLNFLEAYLIAVHAKPQKPLEFPEVQEKLRGFVGSLAAAAALCNTSPHYIKRALTAPQQQQQWSR